MRAYLPGYELIASANLDDTLARLSAEPGQWRIFAGGTDLMVLLEANKLEHRKFLSVWKVPELRGISVTPQTITLGALTTYTDVLRHPLLQQEFPLLARAASQTGSIAIQNRGTLGGNIVNASPAADSPPALLVYNAEVELVSMRGARWLPLRDFFQGYKKIQLAADELLARVRLPREAGPLQHYYRKVGTRKAQAISKVCFAGVRNPATNETRVAVGAVAPIPLRCLQTEAAIHEGRDALATFASEIAPINDIRSTSTYRRRVAQNLLSEFLNGHR